jgi:hypothetical protein
MFSIYISLGYHNAFSTVDPMCGERTQDWRGVLFGVHWNSRGVQATTRAVTSTGWFVDNHGSKGLWSLLLERNNKGNNGIYGHYCDVIRGQLWANITSRPIVVTMCPNKDLGYYCYNDVSLPWSRFPLLQQCGPKIASVPIVEQKCVPTMTPGHTGYLIPRKNATDRHGRAHSVFVCSSLTLEREAHLET